VPEKGYKSNHSNILRRKNGLQYCRKTR
jgi:hypothetical protein